jgi:hypothetical protein
MKESTVLSHRYAMTDPRDVEMVLWVVLADDPAGAQRRWRGVPTEARFLPSMYPVHHGPYPLDLAAAVQTAGPGHVVICIPRAHLRGALVDALGPGHVWQPPREPTQKPTTDPFAAFFQLAHTDELVGWKTLSPSCRPRWRLPSASGEFWADVEFPRDAHELGAQLRWTVDEINRYVAANTTEDSAWPEPTWLTDNTALQWMRARIVDLTIANTYRMAELLGCADLPGRAGLPATSRQKIGRMPHEYREPGPKRDELTWKWNRDWPNFIADDTTVGFLNEALAALRMLSPKDRSAFLNLVVIGLDNTSRTMAQCLGHAWRYVRVRQLETGAGLVFIHRDGNDSWQGWDDSPRSKQFFDGTEPDEPVAPVELQARTHDMLTGFAELLARDKRTRSTLDQDFQVDDLRSRAERIATRFVEYFIDTGDGVWLANAITKSGERLDIAGVNMGLVLSTRFGHRLEPVVKRSILRKLLSICGTFGIPTMDPHARGFQPGGYHNGTTWPWTNGDVIRSCIDEGLLEFAQTFSNAALGALDENWEEIGTDGKRNSEVGTFWTQFVIDNGSHRRVTEGAHPLDPREERNQAWTDGVRIQDCVTQQTLPFWIERRRRTENEGTAVRRAFAMFDEDFSALFSSISARQTGARDLEGGDGRGQVGDGHRIDTVAKSHHADLADRFAGSIVDVEREAVT